MLIPKAVREALGLGEGGHLVFRVGQRPVLARTADVYLVAVAETSGVDAVVSFGRAIDRVPDIRRVES